MSELLNHEIGTHAGLVYRALHAEPAATPTALKKSTGLNGRQIDLARSIWRPFSPVLFLRAVGVAAGSACRAR